MATVNYKPLSASSLIFMAAVEKLGHRADGKRVADKTGMKESATYNLASRLCAGGYLTSERGLVGGFTQYRLTEKGAGALAHVRKALK
jgi:DNA-binding MarR family transcriptional regulator